MRSSGALPCELHALRTVLVDDPASPPPHPATDPLSCLSLVPALHAFRSCAEPERADPGGLLLDRSPSWPMSRLEMRQWLTPQEASPCPRRQPSGGSVETTAAGFIGHSAARVTASWWMLALMASGLGRKEVPRCCVPP